MRFDRRLLAAAALVLVSVTGLVLEARSPAWLAQDPLLQPFGQGPPPPPDAEAERNDTRRTPLPVLLSRATPEELVALPRIGPKTAARILAWRDTVGTVKDLERLQEVRGIGPKTLEGLRPWILLEPEPAATADSVLR